MRAATPFLLLLLRTAQAGAVEVPLSRASFDRAVEEGRACERLDDAGPYVVVKKGTESVLVATMDAVVQGLATGEAPLSFVTVRLTTPYTRVRKLACESKLLGGPFDEDALWATTQAADSVSLWVETETRISYVDSYDGDHEAGPKIEGVALRRGKGPEAIVVPSVSGGGGVEYNFPATALQGKGPFFALIRTEDPPFKFTLKMKRSVLREP